MGDWLIFDNMGADSVHEPSAFNDFQRPAIYYMPANAGDPRDVGSIPESGSFPGGGNGNAIS